MNYRDIARREIARLSGLPESAVTMERTRVQGLGDLTTNVIIRTAKGSAPLEKAEAAAKALRESSAFSFVTVSGPGFLNFEISPGLVREAMRAIAEGGVWPEVSPQKICVEFVSANPTGPLHVGHANGAYTGEAVSAMLEAAGHDVTREYYVNDRGGQISVLGASVIQRMRQIEGESWSIPSDGYPGEYLVPVAEKMLAEHKALSWAIIGPDHAGKRASEIIISGVLSELSSMGISHTSVVSETAVVKNGAYDRMVSALAAAGASYRGTLPAPLGVADPDWSPQETLLFRSSEMGDDSDRALERPDGEPTYFGADCAYHQHKIDRGFDRLINVLGADHAGYTARLAAFVAKASGASIHFKMTSLVKLVRGGVMETMSKRAGKYVTVSDAVAEYGGEELRYFLMSRVQDDVIVLDGDRGVQRRVFSEMLSALREAEAKIADVATSEGWLDLPEESRISRAALAHENPGPGPLADLQIAVLETPEVLSRALRDLAPNLIADHALGLSAAIRKADVAAAPENVLTFVSAAAALRECLKACGTPERALEVEAPEERPEESFDI